jgi:DNA-3-methyladenine glycosylase
LLNCVCGAEGYPCAVLLRAVQPLEGLEQVAARRAGVPPAHWCDGPGKICRALEIDGRLNGADLCAEGSGLWIEAGQPLADGAVQCGSRVGIQSVPEPWLSRPWRFRKGRAG